MIVSIIAFGIIFLNIRFGKCESLAFLAILRECALGEIQTLRFSGRYKTQVTGHRSQVIVLPIQKVSQTPLKANLRPNKFLFRPN